MISTFSFRISSSSEWSSLIGADGVGGGVVDSWWRGCPGGAVVLLGFGSCWCGGIIDDVRTRLGVGVDRVDGGLRF